MRIISTEKPTGKYYYNGWDVSKYDVFTVEQFVRENTVNIFKEFEKKGYTRCYYYENYDHETQVDDDNNPLIVHRAAFFK